MTITLLPQFTKSTNDDDENAINVRSWEDLQKSRPEEIQDNCELDEMRAYSLVGDAESLAEPNELCPNIQQNCCGEVDRENITALWERDSKRIETYTTFTLKTLRYVLGQGENFYNIAQTIVDDYKNKSDENNEPLNMKDSGDEEESNGEGKFLLYNNKYCFNAAEEVLRKNYFHKSTIEPFYYELNQKAEYLHNIRATFYCTLCSVEGQKAVSTHKMIKSLSNINYSVGFCKEIVSNTFNATYQLYDNYNSLLENVVKMLTCIHVPEEKKTMKFSNGSEHAQEFTDQSNYQSDESPYEFSDELEELVNNPLGMSDWGATSTCNLTNGDNFLWFAGCEAYCQKFNIAKANAFFEYDAEKFRNLFDFFLQFEDILPNPDTNVFNDDIITLKKQLEEMYPKLPYEGRFFISKDDSIDFSKFDSDFTMLGTFNPVETANGHQLEFHYETVAVLQIVTMLFFVFFLIRK